MDYTIEIINASSKNMQNLKVIELNTISPSIESLPKIPYEEYKDDMTKYLTNAIQIPLYERQQYLTLPKDSILRITTNNSDEAVFYANNAIKDGIISISPNPFNPGGSDDGLIIVPEGTILEEGSLEIGPKKWAVKLEGNNFKDSYEGSIVTYDVDSFYELYDELMASGDKHFTRCLNYVVDANLTEGDMTGIIELVTSVPLPELGDGEYGSVFPTTVLEPNSLINSVYGPSVESDGFDLSTVSKYVQLGEMTTVCVSELPANKEVIIFYNYDEDTGIIKNSIIHDIEYIPNKSWVLVTSFNHVDETFRYITDEHLSEYTEAKNINEVVSANNKIYIKTKITDPEKGTLFVYETGLALTFNKTLSLLEFKPNTYYIPNPEG